MLEKKKKQTKKQHKQTVIAAQNGIETEFKSWMS